MSDPVQQFYQTRDSIMLPGNWLQYKGYKMTLLDKREARSSLTGVRRLEHAFGYGPFGLHTLQDAVERISEEFIHGFKSSIVEHLQSLQGDHIEGLSPEKMEEIINFPALTNGLDSIGKIHRTKQEILRTLQAKFYEHRTSLGKCCLIATAIFRNFISIFRRDPKTHSFYWIILAKEAFAGGPLGCNRFQSIIKNVAKQSMQSLAGPIREPLQKIQSGQIHELSSEQIEAVITAMEHIEHLEQLEKEILKSTRSYFLNRCAKIHQWCLLIIFFFQDLHRRFNPHPSFFPSSQSIADARLQAQQKSLDYFLLQLRPYQRPLLIWQGKKGEDLFKLYLATGSYSQQLQLYKDDKRLGHVVFCRDYKSAMILSVTNYDFEENEAESFFYSFLCKLARTAKASEIKWYLTPLKALSETPSYSKVEITMSEIEPLRKLLDRAEREKILINLFPLDVILQSL